MCDLASWVETPEKIYYMDNVAIAKYRRDNPDRTVYDVMGHHAIRAYYGISDEGVNRECTDFSTPDNFPSEIVSAIKAGRMSKRNVFPKGLLQESVFLKHPEIKKASDAHDKAWTARERAWSACERVRATYGTAQFTCDKAWSAYKKTRAVYSKAYAAYSKAYAAYSKTRAVHGWRLFRTVENRCPAWR